MSGLSEAQYSQGPLPSWDFSAVNAVNPGTLSQAMVLFFSNSYSPLF